jgi:molybdenum cofactor cytidylyltransferase
MSRAPSWCGVILAAGESSRMGRDKALLPWPPSGSAPSASIETFLSSTIRTLSQENDLVIVVAGNNEAQLAPVVYAHGAFLLRNPDPARGQFSSLQVGLHEVLNRGRDAAMITLVDRPPASAAVLSKLRAAFEAAPPCKWAVVPEYGGKHGHPILIGREMMELFLRAPASSSARDIEHQNPEHIEYVAVEDPSVTINVNTPEEYGALMQSAAQNK